MTVSGGAPASSITVYVVEHEYEGPVTDGFRLSRESAERRMREVIADHDAIIARLGSMYQIRPGYGSNEADRYRISEYEAKP